MRPGFFIAFVLVVIGIGVFMLYDRHGRPPQVQEIDGPAESTIVVEKIVSMPEITFAYTNDFALAITTEELPITSYIPPCEEYFDYCLYYVGTDYEGTNFDSAGVRVRRRSDLTTPTSCLTQSPEGYEDRAPNETKLGVPSTSRFSPIGDAGAGHAAEGELYRLWTEPTCFEFETRIGSSQYANYEPGTIEEFTEADRVTLSRQLRHILDSVTLTATSEKVAFPN